MVGDIDAGMFQTTSLRCPHLGSAGLSRARVEGLGRPGRSPRPARLALRRHPVNASGPKAATRHHITMETLIKFLTVGLSSTWLVGCATPGRVYDDSKIAMIKKDATTEADLLAWFGPASSRTMGPD